MIELHETIARLHSQGLLITRVAGKWQDKSHGQLKVSVVVHNDLFYRVTQKRYWWSNSETCDSGWRYGAVEIVQVVYATKTRKVVDKFWREVV